MRTTPPAVVLATYSLAFLLLAPAVYFSASTASADLFGITWEGELLRIDETNGTGSVIRSVSVTAPNSLVSSGNGHLYTTGGRGLDRLIRIDPTTGNVVKRRNMNAGDFRGITFSPTGELYAAKSLFQVAEGGFQTQLACIDITTGEVTNVGSPLDLSLGAIAFDAAGTLFAWDTGASGHGDGLGLVTLAPDGSGYTDVNAAVGTPLDTDIQALCFGPDGTLYGSSERLFAIDPISGDWTPIGDPYDWDIRGLTFATVPEPQSYFLIATAGAALWRRRWTKGN